MSYYVNTVKMSVFLLFLVPITKYTKSTVYKALQHVHSAHITFITIQHLAVRICLQPCIIVILSCSNVME